MYHPARAGLLPVVDGVRVAPVGIKEDHPDGNREDPAGTREVPDGARVDPDGIRVVRDGIREDPDGAREDWEEAGPMAVVMLNRTVMCNP